VAGEPVGLAAKLKQGKAAFLKKSSKKLLIVVAFGGGAVLFSQNGRT